MGLNNTPKGERIHIAIFGKRNAGKSSLINKITEQDIAVVSDIKGTTTDPVYKSMELLPLGPVMIIDTPGLDDNGELGEKRVEKTRKVLRHTDIGVIVIDINEGLSDLEESLIQDMRSRQIPCLIVVNKIDIYKGDYLLDKVRIEKELKENTDCQVISISTIADKDVNLLKDTLSQFIPNHENSRTILTDLIEENDIVVLVIPIDSAAPKGRIILPQQQTLREILDVGGISVVCKETNLKQTLDSLGRKPKMVITDSQAFAKVARVTPKDVLLTSFSILFARYKGDLEEQVKGVIELNNLKDGDRILIGEGCTHHRQCDDIGTVKIPKWLSEYTKKRLEFEFTSGTEYPQDLSSYAMVIHCGGCMLNKKEMSYRIASAKEQEIPILNYGMVIAAMNGILERSLEVFPAIAALLDKGENDDKQ